MIRISSNKCTCTPDRDCVHQRLLQPLIKALDHRNLSTQNLSLLQTDALLCRVFIFQKIIEEVEVEEAHGDCKS